MFHSSRKWVARFSSFHAIPMLKYPSSFAQKLHSNHPFLRQPWWAANAGSWASSTRFLWASRRAFVAHQSRAVLRRAPDPLRRSQNLYLYGENAAKNEKAVLDVLRICDECEGLEAVRLGENCCVGLVVSAKGVGAWMGVAVCTTSKENAKGYYCFRSCKQSSGVLNILTLMPLVPTQSIRCWVIPGSELRGRQVNVCPKGKWGKYEVKRENVGFAISQEMKRSALQHSPLSQWLVPKSPLHAKEERVFAEVNRRVYAPLGLTVAFPKVKQSPTDAIIGGIQVQNKTALSVKSRRGLQIGIYKFNGLLDDGKRSRQPYHIDDPIDAIVAYCLDNKKLCGMFVFPKSVIAQRGWFQGDGHQGKTTAYLYPPYIIPGRGTEFRHQWQLEYYLDLADEPNLERARALLNSCTKG